MDIILHMKHIGPFELPCRRMLLLAFPRPKVKKLCQVESLGSWATEITGDFHKWGYPKNAGWFIVGNSI